MSSVFEFNFSGNNYEVDKKSQEYKRLKELFPDCDFIFNLKKSPTLMNDGNEYPSVLQFLAKGINEPVGQFIFEKPLDVEVYKLVNKLTDGNWNIEIYIIKTYDSEGSTWNASGKITDKGIYWDISQNEDEEDDEEKDDGAKLRLAAENGDTKTAKSLIDNGADIDAADEDGVTALLLAAREGHTETVELLLDKGAYIEAKTDAGGTPLFAAVVNGQLDCVKMLIRSGANVNVKNKKGKTILMRAEEEGHTETVEYLKKVSTTRGSKDSTAKRKTGDGSNMNFEIPKDFDHLHYIACIFKIFADKVGENLSPDVTNKMTELLQEWLPEDLSAPKIFKMIQPKLNELYNHDTGMLAFFLKTATQEIMEAGIFKESNLRSIVLDLVDIAEADGEITENEAKFINRIAQYFGVEFSITATARGVKKGKREEDSQKVGEQKNNVDAEAYFDKGYQFKKDENYEEAAKWYKKAAEQGHVDAQVSLGLAYSNGEGVPENKKEAAKWYAKAAKQGDKFAQFCLGSAYSEGEGVPEDKKEAVKWHRKAADQGLDLSQFFLGWAYENGEGVHANDQEAIKWYKLAAEQDYEGAQEAVTRLSNINLPNEDNDEAAPKGKRITYESWDDFSHEQGAKDERKKTNLPIAKKIHDLLVNALEANNKKFEIRYGDGTFSFSVPKDKARSGKRTFARVGLLNVVGNTIYLDTLYKGADEVIPMGGSPWSKKDQTKYEFVMKTLDDFEKVKDSIKQGVIRSYQYLAI